MTFRGGWGAPSFEDKVKSELAGLLPERSCCCWSELAAWARIAAQVVEERSERHLILRVKGATLARKAYRLFRALLGQSSTAIRVEKLDDASGRHYRIRVRSPEAGLLMRLGLYDRWGRPVDGIRKFLLRRECCRRSYLRGLFLAAGWIGMERGYQLELELPTEKMAQEVQVLLARLGIRMRRHSQRPKVLYLRRAGAIAECLRLMGASGALLELESSRVFREVKGRVNRLVNCETANLTRTVEAALSRREEIEALVGRIGLENLPASLRQVAELRLLHPEATLRELGELVQPPISKSCVNHRLRRLAALAQELKKEG
ncbi:DNA-binding protein WhiA [Desulfothermobacter acidiphilus]|uniref:DNA-binding protein WhiA n=1 Tax=Desulfothermobacter acidiphilus TaxID=1938353 RepID=UPI003F8B0B9C